MSFFKKSSGEMAKGDSAELGGNIKPIPDNTIAVSMIEEALWKEYEGQRYINLKWKVIDGEYKSRVVFQKLKVYDAKETTADNAKDALYRLFLLCVATPPDSEPTDMELMKALCNKPMAPRYRVWEFDGKSGNWVDAIYKNIADSLKVSAQETQSEPDAASDDDIAF